MTLQIHSAAVQIHTVTSSCLIWLYRSILPHVLYRSTYPYCQLSYMAVQIHTATSSCLIWLYRSILPHPAVLYRCSDPYCHIQLSYIAVQIHTATSNVVLCMPLGMHGIWQGGLKLRTCPFIDLDTFCGVGMCA